jgi:GxxExxY protein
LLGFRREAGLALLKFMLETKPTDRLTHQIIGAAIEVHQAFGPGVFEKVNAAALAVALEDRRLRFQTEVPVYALFKGRKLGRAYLIDFVVEDLVAVEVKAVDGVSPIHLAQAITYVRLAGLPAGLLINFNVKRLVDGVRRIVNDRPNRKFNELATPNDPDDASAERIIVLP